MEPWGRQVDGGGFYEESRIEYNIGPTCSSLPSEWGFIQLETKHNDHTVLR